MQAVKRQARSPRRGTAWIPLCIGLDARAGLRNHQIDHGAQGLLLGGAVQPLQAEMVELPIGAAAFFDDDQRVAHFVLAAEGLGVGRQGLDEGRRVVADIQTPAADRVTQERMQGEIRKNVEPGSALYTDRHWGYFGLSKQYMHDVVDHVSVYVKGRVHTNGIENFWSLVKRALHGTYVSIEPFHVFRYIDEQAFRFNTRKANDGQRFVRLVKHVVGKRLTYDELTGRNLRPA